MSVAIAALGHLGLRREESFASGGAVTDYQPIMSEDLVMQKNFYYGDRIMDTPQQVGGRIMNHGIAGSVTFPISPGNTQIWWRCGVGGSASPYTPARPLESIAIEVDRETDAMYSSGDMISSLEFSSSASNPLQCVAAIEGQGFQDDTASSPSYTSGDDPYLHNEATFEFNDVEEADIMEFSCSVNNNLITDLFANQKVRRDIPATKLQVTGSFTKLFQDTNERNQFLAESDFKIKATYARGANSFELLLNKVKLDTDSEGLSGQTDYVSEAFNFTAFVDDADSENVIQVSVT